MMNNLATTLIVNTVVFSVLLLIVLPLRRRLMTKISPALMLMLWAVVAIKLVIPFGFESRIDLFPSAADAENTPVSVTVPSTAPAMDSVIQDTSFLQEQIYDEQRTHVSAAQAPSYEAVETAPVAKASHSPVDWKALGLGIWGAGVLATVLVFGVGAAGIKRRVRHARLPIPDRVHRILDEGSGALGIRRDVRVVLQTEIGSPLIAGALRPVILLPENAMQLSDAALRHVILHELMHLKRGDLVIIRLMNMLCALYWFNPLVWLGFRLIREDVETACDHSVIRAIGTDQRLAYIGTVLQFAGRTGNTDCVVAAMGMADGRPTMERRIRGMYRAAKTGVKGRATAGLLAVMMLAVCVLTACQPTPEEAIVVGKDQDTMIDAAAQTPETAQVVPMDERVDTPETYTADIAAADGKLTITADGAAIFLPDTDSMDIIRVSAADFTQEQIDGLISALFQGQKLYEVEYGGETKDEIMQQIINIKRLKETEEYSSEGDQQSLDEHIAVLQAKYERAPETSEDVVTVSDGQLKQEENIDYETGEHISYNMGLNATTNPEDYTKAARISVENNNDMTESIVDIRTDEDGNIRGMSGRFMRRMAMLMYENRGDASDSNFGQNPLTPVDEDTVIDDPGVLAKLTTTPAEAKALVEDMLERAGIDNMAVVAMYLTDDENLGNYDGIVSNAEHYAYQMHLCRTVGGVPVAYLNDASSGGVFDVENEISEGRESGDIDAMAQAYSSIVEWYYEKIDVMVDDAGIISFDWWSPLDIGEIVVENTALLPFDDIAAKFEQQMQIKWEAQSKEEYIAGMEFTVDYVSLEYQRVAEQNATETGLLVPVWNFYGTSDTTYDYVDMGDGSEIANKQESGFSEPVSLMTINAVDGSIIDISQGY